MEPLPSAHDDGIIATSTNDALRYELFAPVVVHCVVKRDARDLREGFLREECLVRCHNDVGKRAQARRHGIDHQTGAVLIDVGILLLIDV